jgi:putative phosphoribosyl transferase
MWSSREKAGRQLAVRLRHLKKDSPLVLALPRGGVPVAVEIAGALNADFDLLLVRKLGVPWHHELAMGAVSDGAHPHTVINWDIVREASIGDADIQASAARAIAELEQRRKAWRAGRTQIPIAGRVAILVDDGVATGASIRLALEVARHAGARRLVLAIPVAAPDTADALKEACDEAVFLDTPQDFESVGQYYADFHQLADAEMLALVRRAAPRGPFASRAV